MATQRWWRCDHCRVDREAGPLLPALKAVADSSVPSCPECSRPRRLRLKLDLAFRAGGTSCDVIASFYPRPPQSWQLNASEIVTYLPFLVVGDADNGERVVWLPYWHVVSRDGRELTRYGQWAPYLDRRVFADLVRQAQCAGIL